MSLHSVQCCASQCNALGFSDIHEIQCNAMHLHLVQCYVFQCNALVFNAVQLYYV